MCSKAQFDRVWQTELTHSLWIKSGRCSYFNFWRLHAMISSRLFLSIIGIFVNNFIICKLLTSSLRLSTFPNTHIFISWIEFQRTPITRQWLGAPHTSQIDHVLLYMHRQAWFILWLTTFILPEKVFHSVALVWL